MLTATDTLVGLRESAVALRDSASAFVAELDSAIESAPKDLPEILEALKNQVLSGLAGADARKPSKGTAPRVAPNGVQCPKCTKVLKNDLGLSIHMGREHPKKKKASKPRAEKQGEQTSAEGTEPAAPEYVLVSE